MKAKCLRVWAVATSEGFRTAAVGMFSVKGLLSCHNITTEISADKYGNHMGCPEFAGSYLEAFHIIFNLLNVCRMGDMGIRESPPEPCFDIFTFNGSKGCSFKYEDLCGYSSPFATRRSTAFSSLETLRA